MHRKVPKSLSTRKPRSLFTISPGKWFYLHGVLAQQIKYFTKLCEEVELLKMHLPHKEKDYQTLFKYIEEVQNLLQEHSYAPPSPNCPHIGDSDFTINEHGSNLFKSFQDILKDPNHPSIIETNIKRMF